MVERKLSKLDCPQHRQASPAAKAMGFWRANWSGDPGNPEVFALAVQVGWLGGLVSWLVGLLGLGWVGGWGASLVPITCI